VRKPAFVANHAPGLASLIALRSRRTPLRDEDRKKEWGERLLYNEAGMRAVRLKAEAELALDSHDLDLARERVDQLLAEGGRHIAILRLSLRVRQALGDWPEVLRLTRQLEKHKALTREQAAPLRLRAHREALAALDGDAAQLARYWKSMRRGSGRKFAWRWRRHRHWQPPTTVARRPELVEEFLDHQWDSTLAAAYGQCQGGDVGCPHCSPPRSGCTAIRAMPGLLLTLGRLCRQNPALGHKRRVISEASLAIELHRRGASRAGEFAGERIGKSQPWRIATIGWPP